MVGFKTGVAWVQWRNIPHRMGSPSSLRFLNKAGAIGAIAFG
jgi:hypothetical protein